MKLVIRETNLDGDMGFHGSTSTPEDEREEREEEEETENKSEEIESTGESVVAILGLEKAFFFDDIDVVLPGFVVGVGATVHLAGTGEAAGGRVRVGRGTHWAENWGGVKRRRRLLPIVGWALHVVRWCPPWGSRGRRRVQARHL